MKITDEQVAVALAAAIDEFERWQFSDMGHAGGRAIRNPPRKITNYDGVIPSEEATFDVYPLFGDAKQAKASFAFMRSAAGIRKALESLNA